MGSTSLIHATQTKPGVFDHYTTREEYEAKLAEYRNVNSVTSFVNFVTGNGASSTDWDAVALQALPITGTMWEFNEGNYWRGTASAIGDLTLVLGIGFEIRAALVATRGQKLAQVAVKGFFAANATQAAIYGGLGTVNLALGRNDDALWAFSRAGLQLLGITPKLLALKRATAAPASGSIAAIVARYGNTEQRRFLLNAVRETHTLAEAKGVVYAFQEMRRLGYTLENASFKYRGNQGVDLIFSRNGTYAIVEVKAGISLSSLRNYSGLRQGSGAYNVNRLQRYMQFGDGTNDALAQTLINEASAGRLQSFATLYRSGRIYELPAGWPNTRAIQR